MNHLLSVIITTYNWPSALKLVLQSLQNQTDQHFEVIIADDGSDEKACRLIENYLSQASFSVKHVWHDDQGFRAATIRNKAVARSVGQYLVFLDGDCVVPNFFIARHRKLSEQGWLVAGNRILLNETLTTNILQDSLPIYSWQLTKWWQHFRAGNCNRFLPLVYLPLASVRKCKPWNWRGVKTCNVGIWRKDFLAVNGFDETFVGWGYEDSDLIIRLLKSGVKHKSGRCALPVFHLWHPEQDRSLARINYEKLKASHIGITRARRGVQQYLDSMVE